MDQSETTERTLTRQDVADALGVQVRTVTNWHRDGCPSDFKNGRRLFNLDEVAAWRRARAEGEPEGLASRSTLARAELARKLTLAKRQELDLAAERGLHSLGLADKIREAETHDDLLAYTKEVAALVSNGLMPVSRGNTLRSLVAQMGRTLTARFEQKEASENHNYAMGSYEAVALMEAYMWIVCPDRQARIREYVQREAALDAEEYPNVDLTENPPELTEGDGQPEQEQ